NHHRYNNGQIEHITGAGRDTLYYDSWGDDHPSAEGGQKATQEFIPLLNIAVNRWLATAPGGDGPRPAEPAAQEEPPAVEPRPMPTSSTMIDDFESGTHPESDYWVPYWDEAVATSINCNPSSGTVHQGSAALQIDFEVLADSWASCELLYYHPQDWQGEGLQFYLQSSQAGLPYGLLFYYQLGEERATSVVEFETLPESVGGWVLVSIPWEEFALQDSLVYPESGLGMAFVFGGTAGGTNSGTIWIDDLSLYMDVVEVVPVEPAAQEPAADKPAPVDDGQPSEGEPANQVDAPRSGLPFCANFPLVIGLAAAAGFGLKRRRTEF
ncbi:MAG: hypothetical protein ACK2T7_13175, partial [Anaerolineales bacterium]